MTGEPLLEGKGGLGINDQSERAIRGRVVLPEGVEDDGAVVMSQGRIVYAGPWHDGLAPVAWADPQAWIAPGLIDLHTHGVEGRDTMDKNPGDLKAIAHSHLLHGVTGFLASTITAPPAGLAEAVEVVAQSLPEVPQCLGLHLEGPYVSEEHAGAQPRSYLRPPALAEAAELWERSRHTIRQVTLAPELPGALPLVQWLGAHGILAALGHSGADPAQVRRALALGLSHATHLFNGMPPIYSRHPGPVPALLADPRVTLELIVDGIHLAPDVVKWTVAVAGVHRVVLVTDSIRATGLADGVYDLGGQAIEVEGGIARTEQHSLAGSTLRLWTAVQNMVRFAGVSIVDAVQMASLNPARILGLAHQMGSLTPGKLANVCAVAPGGAVLATWFHGERVVGAA